MVNPLRININLVKSSKGHSGGLSPRGNNYLLPPTVIVLLGTFFGFYFATFLEDNLFYYGNFRTNFLLPNEKTFDEVESGWSKINVFYGSSDHVESLIPPNKRWFSQARQDEAVMSLLGEKRDGYFVDLAANDATTLSNTYALERYYGWSGLCIEPNADYFYNLTRYRKNCKLVAAVIGGNRMEKVHFFEAGDHSGIVGFDNPERLRKKSRQEYTVTLLEVFEKFDVPKEIDYLSLDVEGAEDYIMNIFPLENYTVKLMTIERPKERLRKLLAENSYIQIQRLSRWGETLWAHQDVINELDLSRLDEFNAKKQYEISKKSSEMEDVTKLIQ